MSEDRAYGGVPADERRRERKSRLIEAAIELYGRHGYGAVPVRQICREAGLTERYFYEAFPNAEVLLIASLEAVADIVFDAVEQAVGQAETPAERLDRSLSAFFALVRDHPAQARLFLRGLDGISDAVDEARIRVLQDFVRLYDAQTDGEIAGGLLSTGVIGGVLQIALAWIHFDYRHPKTEVVAAARQLCLAVLP